MKCIFPLLLLCAIARGLSAQPSRPISIEPAIGTQLYFGCFLPATFPDSGPAGANQSWGFEAFDPADMNVARTYSSPSGMPFARNFPTAT